MCVNCYHTVLRKTPQPGLRGHRCTVTLFHCCDKTLTQAPYTTVYLSLWFQRVNGHDGSKWPAQQQEQKLKLEIQSLYNLRAHRTRPHPFSCHNRSQYSNGWDWGTSHANRHRWLLSEVACLAFMAPIGSINSLDSSLPT